ncbi:DNA polymerase I, partial [bacterium]|nr:DNA polymerase I [bacterium]
FAFIKNPLVNSRGEITSAIYGFMNMLISLIEREQPTHLAIVFDTKEPTFRHKRYPKYKATREKMPDDLVGQLGRLDQVLRATGLPLLAEAGWEADDLIGTLAHQAAKEDFKVFMVTGDKDFQQLVTDKIKLYNPKADNILILGPQEVEEKFGVPPEQVIDVLALMGDTSDNVPGVSGIGPKTAVKLVQEYGGLEAVLSAAETMKKSKLRDNLLEHAETARLSRELVTIPLDAPATFNAEDFAYKPIFNSELARILSELELDRILNRLSGTSNNASTANSSSEKRNYIALTGEAELRKLVKQWMKQKPLLSWDLETTSIDPMQAELVGSSLAVEEGTAYYVSMEHFEGERSLTDGCTRFGEPVDDKTALFLSIVQPLLEDVSIPKTGQNIKYDMQVIATYGIEVRGVVFDTMLAAYLINPGSRTLGIDALSNEYLSLPKIPTSDLIGKGKGQLSMLDVELDRITEYACEDADYALRLTNKLSGLLDTQQKILNEIEIPLLPVLRQMEFCGIKLDVGFLREMSAELDRDLERLIKECYAAAGEEFNLNSPKQLAAILFDKLHLPVRKKTKTGPSTDVDTLTSLAELHELPLKLLDYRTLSKLKSTYVDALPALVHPHTGRLHTTFSQTIAATGRLSSNNPNLQNIPIRTEIGRKIREAFIPGEPSWKLVSADYSQIELRIMAHLSEDENLLDAFRRDADIHRETAARMFNTSVENVDADMRRAAKTVNFGIIYGQTDFGLAQELGIPRHAANEFRKNYFKLYPGVAEFMRSTIEKCRENGYVETMRGRRRTIPDIQNQNRQLREFAERTAINTPVQGSAADMIKLAMIAIAKRLKGENFSARMLLQVHDELVFESPADEIETLSEMIQEEMKNALLLSIPITVEVGNGSNWLDAH